MKLIFASLTAATVLATAASAMVLPTQIDNRAAARSALGQVSAGVTVEVPTSSYAFDGRSKVFTKGETTKVTRFKANTRPQNSTDIR